MSRELKPFIRCDSSRRVDMIMTAHILNAALDPIYPATLSFQHRSPMGYAKNCAIINSMITDDMQMDAVAKNFGEEDMVALAINAGCDILALPARGRRLARRWM